MTRQKCFGAISVGSTDKYVPSPQQYVPSVPVALFNYAAKQTHVRLPHDAAL